MSGFELVPVDGGEPIHLPPGDTVLGRGPFLGVSDKRVSRHHGLLKNLNGQLRLKPTHLNPCFVQSSLTDDPRPLQKDTWFPLGDGDLFSLLPGQFIYRVVAVGEEQTTPRNSQMFEEDEDESLLPPNPDVEPVPSPIGCERGQTPPHEDIAQAALPDEASRHLHQAASVSLKEEEAQTSVTPPTVHRKRILPGWMLAATSNGRSSSSKAVKRSKGPVSSSTATQRPPAKQTTPPLVTSPKGVGLRDEEKEEEKRPKQRRRKMSVEEVQATTEFKEERDDFPMAEEEEKEEEDGGSTVDRNITDEKKKTENKGETSQRVKPVGSNSGSVSGTASSKRTPCPYGKDCYRKNPIHFQECSHPGDPDYEEEEEEEEEADRPECPYGTDCYRKNPLHRKEYKHTKRPARTSRTVTQKPQDDDEDEDEDEYDDSFINDDSEDMGDDSDYVPPDSDDSGKEDIKRLQKEAKVFLKRRK